jgi:hypothetical protein
MATAGVDVGTMAASAAAANADSSTVLSILLLCGLMGLLGQGARAAIGLKSMTTAAASAPNQQTEFNAAYLLISLMIGFIAGILAGLSVGLSHFKEINLDDAKLLIGIAVAGYAGADFIENALSIIIPTGAKTPDVKAPDAKPDGGAGAALNTSVQALAGHVNRLIDTVASIPTKLGASTAPAGAEAAVSQLTSPSELKRDMTEATKYLGAIQKAAQQYSLAPSLICAIGSRESNWGQASDMHPKGPAGTGDWARRDPARWGYPMPPDGLGWGRGLMQIDYAQSDFGKTGNWQDPEANIMFGANELAGNIDYFKSHAHGNADPLHAAIAAYNCGRGNVNRAITNHVDVDAFTTGHDYSKDVTARAAWFKSNGFDDLPATA